MILGRNTVLQHTKQVGKIIDKAWSCGDIRTSDAHPIARHMDSDALDNSRSVYKDVDKFPGENSFTMIANARSVEKTETKRFANSTLLASGAAVVGLMAATLSAPVLPLVAGAIAGGAAISAVKSGMRASQAGKTAHVIHSVEQAAEKSAKPENAHHFTDNDPVTQARMEYYLAK